MARVAAAAASAEHILTSMFKTPPKSPQPDPLTKKTTTMPDNTCTSTQQHKSSENLDHENFKETSHTNPLTDLSSQSTTQTFNQPQVTCRTQLFSPHTYTTPTTSPTMQSLSSEMPQQNRDYTFHALQDTHSMQDHYESINTFNSNPLHSFTHLLADCTNCLTLTQQNNSLQQENRSLRTDLIHLQGKYEKAVKGNVFIYRLYSMKPDILLNPNSPLTA